MLDRWRSGLEDGSRRDAVSGSGCHLPVTAVVLTYRRPRQASQVVRELLETEGSAPGQILVVVNGDGGLETPALEAKVTVLRLAENLGPAGGFAHALGFVRDNSTVPWIYLCEDDQGRHRLPAPRLSGLIESVERFERKAPGPPVGVVLASGRNIDMRTGRTYRHEFRSSDAGFEEVDFGPFWGALLSSRVVDAGVFPDEAMFWGAEDLDFWLRVRAAGFRILVDPVAHKAAGNKASSGEPWCGYYLARNGFLLRRRHGDPRWTMWHLLKSVRRFQLAPSRAHRVAIARGLVDGIHGRTGRNAEFSR
jgi:GT2 family glycosyltransferase